MRLIKKLLAIAFALAPLCSVADEPMQVDRFRFEASVVCADGRVAEVHHASLVFPVGATVPSWPLTMTDPHSLDWTIRNSCSANPLVAVRFDVRNVTENGFVVAGSIIDGASDARTRFKTEASSDMATVKLDDGASLLVKRTVVERKTYPNAGEGIKALQTSGDTFD
jgi:hypothetical protein